MFVVQTVSNNVGGSGGGIGYQGIASSVGVEFDTYDNGVGAGDGSGNHAGIDLNGSVNSVAQIPVAPRFNDGNVWTVWVDYDGNNNLLEVRANETGLRPSVALLSYSVDLATVLGTPNAFVGFTSGTGSGYANHDILNWNFESDYNPIGSVPDDANTLALFGLAAIGLAGWKKRSALSRKD